MSQQYNGLEKRFIIHDAAAKEVDYDTFFKTKESGGTLISSAYKLALELITENYNPAEWNIYLFHFSDGDNWSGNDTNECMKILDNHLIPASNMFCYGQVESRYGSGQFLRDLHRHYGDKSDNVTTAQIKDKDAIMDALKIFLGRGNSHVLQYSTDPELRDLVEKISKVAKDAGLDCFEAIFELVDYQQLNEIAAYGGFPTRYPHWKWGMDYERLSKSYEYGLSIIYEMVINNDPCYAYLLRANNLVSQKMVIAHVYGHCDFFKNNYWFKHTNRKMLDQMANHSTIVRRFSKR